MRPAGAGAAHKGWSQTPTPGGPMGPAEEPAGACFGGRMRTHTAHQSQPKKNSDVKFLETRHA